MPKTTEEKTKLGEKLAIEITDFVIGKMKDHKDLDVAEKMFCMLVAAESVLAGAISLAGFAGVPEAKLRGICASVAIAALNKQRKIVSKARQILSTQEGNA